MSVASAFERHLHYSRGVLRICDDLYHVDSYSRVLIVAFGRSAHEMCEAFAGQLGALGAGIISAPECANRSQVARFRYFYGGEELPNAESLRAAHAILRSLGGIDANGLVIYLISAGSAMVESPIDDSISLCELISTYEVLAASPASPDEARAILKHLSAVKGGRMALAVGSPQAQQVSIICDASGDQPPQVACGPTMPSASSAEECYEIAARFALAAKFPASVRELFEKRALEDAPDKDHPGFHNCRWWLIA
jgi:hydroxypyruvate reductase